jgi:hypothetical protein
VSCRLLALFAIIAAMACSARAQSGGPYEIVSSVVGGGGGSSSGTTYAVRGTVGQPEAGAPHAGGTFSLQGGFWPSVLITESCPADLAPPLGVLNFFDVSAFLGAYNSQDPVADFAAPFGVFNFFDVSAFLASYNAGCP